MNVLTVIPARAGSKGVPRKNLKTLGGRPLVVWSVEAALASKKTGAIIVSSDSSEILQVACVSPTVRGLKRPDELAQDATPIFPVYRHAIEAHEKKTGRTVDYVVGLEPTTPFRSPQDIDACVTKAIELGADAVITVKLSAENPYFVLVEPRSDDPRWVEQSKKGAFTRRQDAPPVYTVNGAVYVFTRAALFGIENLYQAARLAVVEMPWERSVDIDSPSDFEFAEFVASRHPPR
jgi:CMP-N,N'-diacetyllegionaminic acid synthase